MKTVIILFASSKSLHIFDKAFNDNSAFDLSLAWAHDTALLYDAEIVVFTENDFARECTSALNAWYEKLSNKDFKKPELILKDFWSVQALFMEFSEVCAKYSAQNILFSWADCPFICKDVTKEILQTHLEYHAEYTFADGYPYGLCPEALNSGAAAIIAELCKSRFTETLTQPVCRTSIFDTIKKDINSFEIETVISDEDFRMFRVSLDAGTKANFTACKTLFSSIKAENKDIKTLTALDLSKKAVAQVGVLKTVPSYYNIQITDKANSNCIYLPEEVHSTKAKNMMDIEKFRQLVKNISLFSETAVVSLSAFGEPLCHPDFIQFVKAVLSEPGLSVLIETDGVLLTAELCKEIADFAVSVPARLSGGEVRPAVYWILNLDAFTHETYSKIRSNGTEEAFNKAKQNVALLAELFPGSVYPQLTRMNENEVELEPFYRFWSAKESPSKGAVIIQKYDSLAGSLPDKKPADLSPLGRNPCWHIRRDLTVLADGSVPFCRCQYAKKCAGNAFTNSLEEIWESFTQEVLNQMNGKYSEVCGGCDEYYTFNF